MQLIKHLLWTSNTISDHLPLAERNAAWVRGIFGILVFKAQNHQWKAICVLCNKIIIEFRFQVGEREETWSGLLKGVENIHFTSSFLSMCCSAVSLLDIPKIQSEAIRQKGVQRWWRQAMWWSWGWDKVKMEMMEMYWYALPPLVS